MDGWQRLIDGMVDPMPADENTRRRRQAIKDVLRLMECHCLEGTNCDHVDAIRELVDCTVQQTGRFLVDGIRALPRPLHMRAIADLVSNIAAVTLINAAAEDKRR